MMRKPVKTTYPHDETTEQLIQDINVLNNADAHNSELALNQSVFGRAYELIYRTEDTHFIEIDVKEAFVIYDATDRKSTRLNSSHVAISYAVFCLKKKSKHNTG